MVDFIDKTNDQAGTPINRGNLMAIQGFDNKTFVRDSTGNIVVTKKSGETLNVSYDGEGSIITTFVGERTIVKKTTFNDLNTITEELI